MSNNFSPGKRARENELARKRKEKEERRLARRDRGPGQVEIVSADQIQGGMPSIEEAMAALENRGQVERSAASIPARLFVGGLSDEVTEHDLREVFGAYGKVADVVVMLNRDTRMPRGFGFVTMENRRDAPRVIDALDGTPLKGRNLVVNMATDRPR